MTTRAKRAMGTTLARDGHSIAELTRIAPVETTLDTTDVTSLDTEGDFKEFIGTLFEAGEVEIEGFFYPGDSDGQIGLRSDHLAKTLQNFTITFPAAMAASWSFTALVTKFSAAEATVDGALKFSATLKISGQPTLNVTLSTGLTDPFLTISDAAIVTPAAAGDVYDYVATVLTGVSSVTITPTAADGTITITVNGSTQTVVSGQASSAIVLGAAGSITTVTITVTETNKVPVSYAVRIARAAA